MDTAHDYDTIWRESGATIWRSVYAYAGGIREVADDAVAEAFARAMAHDADVRDPSPTSTGSRSASRPPTWCAGSRRRPTCPRSAIADPSANGLPDLFRALRELTPAQRAAVYLHYRVDLPVREVARVTGMSSAAVKVHLMRGRRRLRELLGEEDDA